MNDDLPVPLSPTKTTETEQVFTISETQCLRRLDTSEMISGYCFNPHTLESILRFGSAANHQPKPVYITTHEYIKTCCRKVRLRSAAASQLYRNGDLWCSAIFRNLCISCPPKWWRFQQNKSRDDDIRTEEQHTTLRSVSFHERIIFYSGCRDQEPLPDIRANCCQGTMSASLRCCGWSPPYTMTGRPAAVARQLVPAAQRTQPVGGHRGAGLDLGPGSAPVTCSSTRSTSRPPWLRQKEQVRRLAGIQAPASGIRRSPNSRIVRRATDACSSVQRTRFRSTGRPRRHRRSRASESLPAACESCGGAAAGGTGMNDASSTPSQARTVFLVDAGVVADAGQVGELADRPGAQPQNALKGGQVLDVAQLPDVALNVRGKIRVVPSAPGKRACRTPADSRRAAAPHRATAGSQSPASSSGAENGSRLTNPTRPAKDWVILCTSPKCWDPVSTNLPWLPVAVDHALQVGRTARGSAAPRRSPRRPGYWPRKPRGSSCANRSRSGSSRLA